jgi:hypothetical protein
MSTFTSWNSPSQPPDSGSLPLLGPAPVFRNMKDQRLAAFGATPDTQYPDGYLGTGHGSRRQDKILGKIARQNQRQYTRGVHKGERINPGDYVWPDEFNLFTSLQLEAKGKKFAPVGAESPRLVNDGKDGPRGIPRGLSRPQQQVIDQQRRARLKGLAPTWR